MRWYKVTGATGCQNMSERVSTAQHCQFVHWTYTIEQGTYKYDEQS